MKERKKLLDLSVGGKDHLMYRFLKYEIFNGGQGYFWDWYTELLNILKDKDW